MPRRVITGFDERGKSVFVADGEAKVATHVWETTATPTNESYWGEPEGDRETNPPERGTRFRVLEIPPLPPERRNIPGDTSGMHTTLSVDYIVVMAGEIVLVLEDEAETLLKAGDVCILRGVVHAWRNRSDATCLMAAVLVSATNKYYPNGYRAS